MIVMITSFTYLSYGGIVSCQALASVPPSPLIKWWVKYQVRQTHIVHSLRVQLSKTLPHVHDDDSLVAVTAPTIGTVHATSARSLYNMRY